MKSNFLYLILIVLLTGFYPDNIMAQQNTVFITLNVDTQAINQNNINQVSNFGQGPGISNRDFTTDVNIGDLVIWNGRSTSSPQDQVLITLIEYEDGTRIISKNRLNDNQTPGKVVGSIDKGSPGDEMKYLVKFVIKNGNVERGPFTIDPKLKIAE